MTVTVDRTKPTVSKLRLSALLIQHSLEYASSDPAGVQRAIDFMNDIYSDGWVGTHGSSPGFRIVDAMPTEGKYVWATSGSNRGLFDPASAAVPMMAKIAKAKRALVTFGVPKPYSSNSGAADYDFYPCVPGAYTKLGAFWVRVLQEAENRGMPFDRATHRQELKKQPNRNFGAGGGGQSEVDSYNAIRYAIKSWRPDFHFDGPHIGLGGTANVNDRARPLSWSWDKDFLNGWMQRVDGWDTEVLLDYANTDYAATTAAQGMGNPDLQATWVSNWGQIGRDFMAMVAPYVGPSKPAAFGFIEHYSLEVNLDHWNLYTDQQKASFQFATLAQMALSGCGSVFDWQPEGASSGSTFQDYFGLFNKTAVGSANANTGKPTAKGLAVKAFHDMVQPGGNIYNVTTGDPRVYGIATGAKTAIINLNKTAWTDKVEGSDLTVQPYSYSIVPAAPTDVTLPLADVADIKQQLTTIQNAAAEALSRLP